MSPGVLRASGSRAPRRILDSSLTAPSRIPLPFVWDAPPQSSFVLWRSFLCWTGGRFSTLRPVAVIGSTQLLTFCPPPSVVQPPPPLLRVAVVPAPLPRAPVVGSEAGVVLALVVLYLPLPPLPLPFALLFGRRLSPLRLVSNWNVSWCARLRRLLIRSPLISRSLSGPSAPLAGSTLLWYPAGSMTSATCRSRLGLTLPSPRSPPLLLSLLQDPRKDMGIRSTGRPPRPPVLRLSSVDQGRPLTALLPSSPCRGWADPITSPHSPSISSPRKRLLPTFGLLIARKRLSPSATFS